MKGGKGRFGGKGWGGKGGCGILRGIGRGIGALAVGTAVAATTCGVVATTACRPARRREVVVVSTANTASEAQLAQLREMGFRDRELNSNVATLRASQGSGSLDGAISWLTARGSNHQTTVVIAPSAPVPPPPPPPYQQSVARNWESAVDGSSGRTY
jgi:hypothetical protein